jgi:hypothetical protein
MTVLVSLSFLSSQSSALTTSSTAISSWGTVQYPPTPTPTPIPAKNYAEIPACWLIGEPLVAPTYLDYSVLHNGHPSVRMEKGDGSKPREIWCVVPGKVDNWIYINPGDHIVFKVWMKTGASTIGCTHVAAGIRLGIDFYTTATQRITGIQSPDGDYWKPPSGPFPPNQYLNYVNWGTDWEQRIMDFTIPAQYPADPFAAFPAGTMVTPAKIMPWMQVWCDIHGNADDGVAWFADAELYINP